MAVLTRSIIYYPVTDLASLKAIDTTGRVDGLLVNVFSMGQFVLDITSTAIPDDRDIVQPTVGPGRWYRQSLEILGTSAATGGILPSYLALDETWAFSNNTDASSYLSAPITFAGGVGIAKKLYLGVGIYLPTTGGTPSILNFYEKTTLSTTIGGVWAADQSVIFTIERNGSEVTITWPDVIATGNSSAADITVTGTGLDARFRPAIGTQINTPICVKNDGNNTLGDIAVDSSGGITFQVIDIVTGVFGGFTATTNDVGILGGSVSYSIA